MFCSVNKVVVCTVWKLWKWMMKSYMLLMIYQMLPKRSKSRYQKELEKFTRK
jgi:hypothetical protein